jgi:diacylglycerol kinase family enzyme
MARNLKIPLNKKEAIELLINPRVIRMDVGLINDHYFFNVAGFGLDAEVSENYEEFGIRGPVSYFIVGTRTFFKYKSNPVTIRFDSQEINLKPLVVTVANSPEYGVGASIAPAAVPYDGYLDLVVVESLSVWKAVSNVYRLFNGTISEINEYQHYRVKTVEIIRNEAGTIEIDGNVHFEPEKLTIKVSPEKLKVAVGPDFK